MQHLLLEIPETLLPVVDSGTGAMEKKKINWVTVYDVINKTNKQWQAYNYGAAWRGPEKSTRTFSGGHK
jgi:hypothetical protein